MAPVFKHFEHTGCQGIVIVQLLRKSKSSWLINSRQQSCDCWVKSEIKDSPVSSPLASNINQILRVNQFCNEPNGQHWRIRGEMSQFPLCSIIPTFVLLDRVLTAPTVAGNHGYMGNATSNSKTQPLGSLSTCPLSALFFLTTLQPFILSIGQC